MAIFIRTSVFICTLCAAFNHGEARSQGGSIFVVQRDQDSLAPSSERVPLLPYSEQSEVQTHERFYILRRKPSKTKSHSPIMLQNNYPDEQTSTSSFSIPILSEGQSHRRHDTEAIEDGGYVSLEQAYAINKAFEEEQNSKFQNDPTFQLNTPIMVEGRGPNHNNLFQSNIPLPYNPYMENVEVRSDNSMNIYQPSEPEPLVPEQGLQNVLDKYLNDLYKSKSPNSQSSTGKSTYYYSNAPQSSTDYTTRSDTILPLRYNQNIKKYTTSSSSHYTKSGPLQDFSKFSNVQVFQKPESRHSIEKESYISLLSKLKRLYQLKEVFPPAGSYTPYGERTIIMLKYPGMPEKSQGDSPSALNRDFDINLPVDLKSFSLKNFLKPGHKSYTGGQIKMKASDFGVIISQNYILQPDVSMNSHYGGGGEDGISSNPGNLVGQLATALAERNRIVNTFSSSPQSKGKDITTKPPFVLVHLETFTKKSNKTTAFGFDDEIEKHYSNGTIIYPTKNNPSVLASTKFEFENIDDVEHIFDRPLEGYHEGRMKPIVPLGMAEIRNYLKLMYEVHKDIHDGGMAKVKQLNGLSFSIDRQKMAGSRTLEEWEAAKSQRKYNDNWLHTSTIGLRSLGEYPLPQYPGRPHIAVSAF